ncbi:hypothetical protein BJV74DRAFT_149982 [Russula compacta]|nr:hypothetical protein BJV74DRAFT_149982 [Russula compacta]
MVGSERISSVGAPVSHATKVTNFVLLTQCPSPPSPRFLHLPLSYRPKIIASESPHFPPSRQFLFSLSSPRRPPRLTSVSPPDHRGKIPAS